MSTLDELKQALTKLSTSDAAFAASLANQWERKGTLSPKQAVWVDKLVGRANNPEPPRDTAKIGDLQKIQELFNKAKQHLKSPAIVLNVPGGVIRLTVATQRAQVPGSLNVVDPDAKVWYGRILQNGVFEASRKQETPAPVIAKLKAFAKNPSKVAGEDGRLNGRCCFCMKALDDPRSTAMGYGPVCADHFDLEWGQQRFSFKQ